MESSKNISEGELFISEFLKRKRIIFRSQEKISGLTNDSKQYRIADFYLVKYKLFIEFNGLWNTSEEYKQAYKQKMAVYEKNRIPCIYLYPENLGILDYTFNFRVKQTLRKHSLHKELRRYNWHLLITDRGDLFIWLTLSAICLLIMDYDIHPEDNLSLIILFGGLLLYQVYRFVIGYKKYFLSN
jgi:hypothetical protein